MNQRIVVVAVLALAGAACGKKNDERSLEPAAFGKAVAPPGELGKLKVGMPVAEAKKVAPDLIPQGKETYDSFKAGWKGVRFGVGLTDDLQKIDRLRVDLPKSAREMLVNAWGPGQEATCTSKPCTYWFDAASGTRAVLEDGFRDDLELEFTDYLPMEKLLAAKPTMLGFETAPVFGATLDELRTPYAGILVEQKEDEKKGDKKMEWFDLPPTAYGMYTTYVHTSFDRGRLSELRFDIEYDNYPAAKDTILAAFETAWGKGFPITDNINRAMIVWLDPASGRRATVDPSMDGRIMVHIDRYLPLDKLLGEGPDKLGFETTPLIGMTWPEIEKAYPDYVETQTDEEAQAKRKELENFMGEDKDKLAVLGEAKGGSTFKMPGTEWGDFTLVHLRYDDAGKVRQFAFDVPWGDYPASKDTILAALEKKYGAKKEITKYGRTEYELRAKDPRVTAESSDITKNWQIEVGADP